MTGTGPAVVTVTPKDAVSVGIEILQSAEQATARTSFSPPQLKVKYYDQIYRLKPSPRRVPDLILAAADLGKYHPVGQGRPPE
jgi:hypothetical protein